MLIILRNLDNPFSLKNGAVLILGCDSYVTIKLLEDIYEEMLLQLWNNIFLNYQMVFYILTRYEKVGFYKAASF